MGNNRGKADQGRFSSGHPKKPKPHKCRACKQPLAGTNWRRIGGSRYHEGCR